MRLSLLVVVALLLSMSSVEAAMRQCRNSITGHYVSKAYAKKHPDITTCKR